MKRTTFYCDVCKRKWRESLRSRRDVKIPKDGVVVKLPGYITYSVFVGGHDVQGFADVCSPECARKVLHQVMFDLETDPDRIPF